MPEIYLDNAATTRTDEVVAARMTEVMLTEYANPSSLHSLGVEAELLLERSRRQTLAALGAKTGRIVFTSGGTEANNLAIIGAARALRRRGHRIVTTAIEHASVLQAFGALASEGFETVFVPPGADGRIDPERFLDSCDDQTVLATMMLVNNETGAVTPVAKIAQSLRKRSPVALLHTDAIQGFGKIAFSPESLGADLVSVSGHKIHAPKGIGALYIADRARVWPILFGGGQQYGLRPGTEPMPALAGLALASQLARERLCARAQQALFLRTRIVERLGELGGILINSPAQNVSPFLLNVSVLGYRSETLLHFLAQRKIYVSSGSACSRGEQSHVLRAQGLDERRIDAALRISFCGTETENDADAFCAAVEDAMRTIKKA
jgi:cysteine desulfurase